jgi:TIR domain
MSSLAEFYYSNLVGFFSYSPKDDEDSAGALRSVIHRELSVQLGRSHEDLRIWQDKAAIPQSAYWESEIKEAIDQSVFFIPIITPSVIGNPRRAFELNAFRERQARLGRHDLVFPIFYIPVPETADVEFKHREYLDWRHLRHQDLGSGEAVLKLERFCRSIADALRRPWLPPEKRRIESKGPQFAQRAQASRVSADEARRALEDARGRLEEEEAQRRRLEDEARRRVEPAQSTQQEAQRRIKEELQGRQENEQAQRRSSKDEARRMPPPMLHVEEADEAPPVRITVARSERPAKTQTKSRQRQIGPQTTRERFRLRYERDAPAAARNSEALDTRSGKVSKKVERSDHVEHGSSDRTTARSDEVDCSVFAPTAIRSGAEALIQVFLHVPADAIVALGIAVAADASVDRKITHSLNMPIERGANVQIFFDPAGLLIPNRAAADQSIVWRGHPVSCAFRAIAPKTLFPQNYHPTIRVAVNGILVGCITFQVRCSLFARPAEPLLAGAAKTYRSAFVSYASADRHEVLKRTQALRAAIRVRQDVLDLDPGARWEAALYKWIDEADLFLLCWSQSARDSTWVMREARYALKRQGRSSRRLPDIVPLVLEPPSQAKPPKWLSHLHFNDSICAILAAERANRT